MKKFLDSFSIKKIPKTVKIGRTYYTDPELTEYRPYYSGECIAHERGNTLIPSISFLQYIGKHAKYKVQVSSKGEWLFICGRNINAKHITNHNNPKKDCRVVILNAHKECIGYGDVIAEFSEKKDVIQRIFDIGDLLRRERKTKKPKRF